MSWESTAIYYRLMNELVRTKLGGNHSAKIIIWSFDFDEIVSLQNAGDWQAATLKMVEAANNLKNAGAEALVICTNTMHKMADEVEKASDLPVWHIADATAMAIKKQHLQKIGLLATKFTMEQDFYKNRLKNHNIETIIPNAADREIIHRVIYDELCQGVINPASKIAYINIINQLINSGAEGIVLGCTEIGMLIQSADLNIPIFDTTSLHAEYAVNLALG